MSKVLISLMERRRDIRDFIKGAAAGFAKDEAARSSAVVSFYTIMSLTPMLIILLRLVALFLAKAQAQPLLVGQLGRLMGAQGVGFIQIVLGGLRERSSRAEHLPLLGYVALVYGAAGAMVELSKGLDRIVVSKARLGWAAFIFRRLRSLLLLCVACAVTIISIGLTAVIGALRDYFPAWLPYPAVVLEGLNGLLLLGLMAGLLALIYRWLPVTPPRWRSIWKGASFAAVVFLLEKYALNLYLEYTPMKSLYGAFASLIALLLWVHGSFMIIFFGAEMVRQDEPPMAAAGREDSP